MGTESKFYLTSHHWQLDEDDLPEGIIAPYMLSRLIKDGEVLEAKWYDYLKDMKTLSKKYPKETLIIERHVENGEFFKSWVKDGKEVTVEGEVTYPKPDFDNMK